MQAIRLVDIKLTSQHRLSITKYYNKIHNQIIAQNQTLIILTAKTSMQMNNSTISTLFSIFEYSVNISTSRNTANILTIPYSSACRNWLNKKYLIIWYMDTKLNYYKRNGLILSNKIYLIEGLMDKHCS